MLIITGFFVIFALWGLLYYFALKNMDRFMQNWQRKMAKEIDETMGEARKSLEEAYESIKSAKEGMEVLLTKEKVGIGIKGVRKEKLGEKIDESYKDDIEKRPELLPTLLATR